MVPILYKLFPLMFDTFTSRLELNGTLTTVTALRIGAGRSTEPIGSDIPVVKDALGHPFIPGSSFKGALRSRLESFLRGIYGNNRHKVADPSNEKEWSITAQEITALKKEHKQKEHKQKDQALTDDILKGTDRISALFGSPWLASKFQVRDLLVQDGAWFGQYQERDGVAIDRDTETADKLYNFQVVPPGTPFKVKIIVENAEEWELGLLVLGLSQFEQEQIPLGGGRSRGLGVVKLKIDDFWWFDSQKDDLLTYLQALVNQQQARYAKSDADIYAKSDADIEIYRELWAQALMDKIKGDFINTATLNQL